MFSIAVWIIDPPALAANPSRIAPVVPIGAAALAKASPFLSRQIVGLSLKVQSPHTICRESAAIHDPVISPVPHVYKKRRI